MKARRFVLLSLALCACLAVVLFLARARIAGPAKPRSNGPAEESQLSNVSSHKGPLAGKSLDKNLELLLIRIGVKKPAPLAEVLPKIITLKSANLVREAFKRLCYSGRWSTHELQEAMSAYAENSDPAIRFAAGECLLITGDKRGAAALESLVENDSSVPSDRGDLRVRAADVLALFNSQDAAQGVSRLYVATRDPDLVGDLAELGVPLPNASQYPYVPSQTALEQYAEMGNVQYVDKIKATFEQTADPELKAAAAFALVALNADETAANYLDRTAEEALSNMTNGAETFRAATLIKYVGAVRSPDAQSVLESALASSDQTVRTNALVNLLINQASSQQAVTFLANQLNEVTRDDAGVPWEVALPLANSIMENTEIQQAGSVFQAKSGDGSWQLATVDRHNWPLYPWIANYTFRLK